MQHILEVDDHDDNDEDDVSSIDYYGQWKFLVKHWILIVLIYYLSVGTHLHGFQHRVIRNYTILIICCYTTYNTEMKNWDYLSDIIVTLFYSKIKIMNILKKITKDNFI